MRALHSSGVSIAIMGGGAGGAGAGGGSGAGAGGAGGGGSSGCAVRSVTMPLFTLKISLYSLRKLLIVILFFRIVL